MSRPDNRGDGMRTGLGENPRENGELAPATAVEIATGIVLHQVIRSASATALATGVEAPRSADQVR